MCFCTYIYIYIYIQTGCPTRYGSRHFFNNSNINEDSATKQTRNTDTFLFISHTTNVLLFKFRCNIFIDVRIIKEMPGSVASGTLCVCVCVCVCIYIYTHTHTTHTHTHVCVCVCVSARVCVCVCVCVCNIKLKFTETECAGEANWSR